jgi:hypothetical protein
MTETDYQKVLESIEKSLEILKNLIDETGGIDKHEFLKLEKEKMMMDSGLDFFNGDGKIMEILESIDDLDTKNDKEFFEKVFELTY